MAFNTGNPIGSTDPRDFSDNSENLDRAVNNTASATWTDRFGNARTSLAGQIGYIGTGADGAIEDYAAGQELTTFSTIIRYSGEFYRPASGTTLPYTTTATTPDVDANLVPVGDATLRQDLADNTAGSGTDLLAHTGTSDTVTEALDKRTIYVGSVAELEALSSPVGTAVYLTAEGRAGEFVVKAGTPPSDPQKGIYIVLANGNYAQRVGYTRTNALIYGAARDGVTSASAALQAMATRADDELLRSVYIPNESGVYFTDATVTFEQPGVRIYGDAGPTYQRGSGKEGYFTFDDSVFSGPVFDLGNSRTTGNPADEWTVEGLGFLGSNRSVDGISITTQTNGPDRGARFSRLSGKNMRSVVHIAPNNPGVDTSVANLCIENSNLSNNKYGLLSEGNVLGLRFVNNQAEQNTSGAIYGEFSSGITIEDNMLEGQPTPITIFQSETGNRPKISVKRNYFEVISGAYTMNFSGSTSDCYAEIGPNYIVSDSADDYLLLSRGNWFVTMRDEKPVTLEGIVKVLHGSDIFHKSVSSYEIRDVSVNTGAEVDIERMDRFLSVDRANYAWRDSMGADTVYTPFGVRATGVKATGTTGFFGFTMPGVAGDVLVFSILMRAKFNGTNNTIMQVFNSDSSANIGQVSDVAAIETESLGGGWSLVQLAVEITGDTLGAPKFRFFNASGTPADVEMATAAVRNYGAIPAGGKIEVTPICII